MRDRIAEHGMLKTMLESLGDFGTYGEIKVGNPQRSKVVTAKDTVESDKLYRIGAAAVNDTVEVVSVLHPFAFCDNGIHG